MQVSFVSVKPDGSTQEIMSLPMDHGFPREGDRVGVKVADGIIIFQVAAPPQWNFEKAEGEGTGVKAVVVLMMIQVGQMSNEEVNREGLGSKAP